MKYIMPTDIKYKDKALEIAQVTGISVVTERWLGGTITNFNQIKKSLDKLADITSKNAKELYGLR